MEFSREKRGWEMFPGVATGCKNTRLLYIRHWATSWGYEDRQGSFPAPQLWEGEKEKS